MITSVDVAQRALQLPANSNFIVFTGESASGKTDMLVRRYMWLLRRDPTTALASTVVTAANAASARALAARIGERLDPLERDYFLASPFVGHTLDALAYAILDTYALESRLALDLNPIEAWESEAIFERAAEPLFSADWAEFLGPDVDPDISGLRAPDRFSAAVLRLIRKLRDAQISPDDFLAMSLRGATSFYASPPNFTNPTLLYATKEEYRSSLAVDRFELERQRRREIDLAKIIAKLYSSYLAEVVRHGCMTGGDAIAEATRLLLDEPVRATLYRKKLLFTVLDDLHDLRGGELRFLQTIFGENLARVTAAGDLRLATQTFAGARPEAAFALARTTVPLAAGPQPEHLMAIAAIIRDPNSTVALPAGDTVRLARASSRTAEAALVADAVAAAIASGTPPARIAVVHRSARCLGEYEEALIERNVPIALRGDIALLARRDVQDALAVLFCAVDPYRHAWLMRALQRPGIGFSDASLALLCGEPSNAQVALFELPPEAESDRRWDRKRDLRLGSNVVRGERDSDLDDDTRTRLAAFRSQRAGWVTALRESGVGAVRAVLVNAGMFDVAGHETAARGRRRRRLLDATIALIERTAVRRGNSSVAETLDALAAIAALEAGPITIDRSDDAVVVGAIDALETDRFEHVFVVDVRAGSFPPYYVPDAFLFSPQYGMIAKDNTGEARAARTAKFTWYQHKTNLRESYAREHRRLLARAMTRADATVTISAHGKATRGVGAPEFLSELEALRPALAELAPASGPAIAVAFADLAPSAEREAALTDTVMPLHAAVALVANADTSAARAPATVLTPPSDRYTRVHADLSVLLRMNDVTVAGAVDAVVTDGDTYFAVVGGTHAAIEAAFVVTAFNAIHSELFVRREADGTLTGPHAVDAQALVRFRQAVSELSSRFHPAEAP